MNRVVISEYHCEGAGGAAIAGTGDSISLSNATFKNNKQDIALDGVNELTLNNVDFQGTADDLAARQPESRHDWQARQSKSRTGWSPNYRLPGK